jgi:hypothetical protein
LSDCLTGYLIADYVADWVRVLVADWVRVLILQTIYVTTFKLQMRN